MRGQLSPPGQAGRQAPELRPGPPALSAPERSQGRDTAPKGPRRRRTRRAAGDSGPPSRRGRARAVGCRPGGRCARKGVPQGALRGGAPEGLGLGAAGTGGLIPACGPGPEPHLPPAHQGRGGSPAAATRPGRSRRSPEGEDRPDTSRRVCACVRRSPRMPGAGAGDAPVAAGSAAFPVCAAMGGAWALRCERGGETAERTPGGGEGSGSETASRPCGPG